MTLVDAGFPGHYSVYKKGLESLGKTSKDLEAIVLTHAHADHIGFAERVRKETGPGRASKIQKSSEFIDEQFSG